MPSASETVLANLAGVAVYGLTVSKTVLTARPQQTHLLPVCTGERGLLRRFTLESCSLARERPMALIAEGKTRKISASARRALTSLPAHSKSRSSTYLVDLARGPPLVYSNVPRLSLSPQCADFSEARATSRRCTLF